MYKIKSIYQNAKYYYIIRMQKIHLFTNKNYNVFFLQFISFLDIVYNINMLHCFCFQMFPNKMTNHYKGMSREKVTSKRFMLDCSSAGRFK